MNKWENNDKNVPLCCSNHLEFKSAIIGNDIRLSPKFEMAAIC